MATLRLLLPTKTIQKMEDSSLPVVAKKCQGQYGNMIQIWGPFRRSVPLALGQSTFKWRSPRGNRAPFKVSPSAGLSSTCRSTRADSGRDRVL